MVNKWSIVDLRGKTQIHKSTLRRFSTWFFKTVAELWMFHQSTLNPNKVFRMFSTKCLSGAYIWFCLYYFWEKENNNNLCLSAEMCAFWHAICVYWPDTQHCAWWESAHARLWANVGFQQGEKGNSVDKFSWVFTPVETGLQSNRLIPVEWVRLNIASGLSISYKDRMS